MKTDRKSTPRMTLGKAGEDAVCEFLIEKGHVIIDRNRRIGHLEIDIITLDGGGLHFVEVKSRMAPTFVAPQANVTMTKQRRIAEAAVRYLSSSKDPRLSSDLETSFDVAAVTFNGGKTIVEWIPQAYIPVFV
jgi:Predicted endonuclease distantly related to archaeal Holliday junction resolvase